MIHLVLDADRQQALGVEAVRRAVAVERADGDAVGAADPLVDPGHRQAALFHLLDAVQGGDLGVDETERLVLALGDVDDDHPAVDVDLGRGQADAGRRVHGFEHVVDQPAHVVVDRLDRFCAGPQARIREVEYIQ